MRTTDPLTRRARLNFTLFALAVLGAGWLGVLIDLGSGAEFSSSVAVSNSGGTTGLAVFLLGPVVAAVLLRLLSRDGAGPFGFTLRFPHRTSWFAGSLVLYPLIAAVAIGVGAAFGVADLTWTPADGKPGYLAAFAALLGVQLVKNLFEELVFRGYGTRTAAAMGLRGRLTPHLLVGVVWGLWHLPLYLVWTSPADMRLITSLPWLLYLPLLVVGVTASAIVYGEMRLRTGSLWPGIALHCMCNAVATPLLVNGHLTFTGHGDVLASPVPSSIVATLLFAAVGLWLARRPAAPPAPRPTTQEPALATA